MKLHNYILSSEIGELVKLESEGFLSNHLVKIIIKLIIEERQWVEFLESIKDK